MLQGSNLESSHI